MNEVNASRGIKEPKIIKEKVTGVWKIAFEYRDIDGKLKRYYYSKGVNDKIFFHLDSEGKKKGDANGAVIIKNVKRREELAKKRLSRLNRDLDNYVFDTRLHCFLLGDLDRMFTDVISDYIEFKKGGGAVNEKSLKQYESKLNGLRDYLVYKGYESIKLKEFGKEHLDDFYSYILNTLEYSKGYRDDYHRFFVSVYNYLINFKDLNIPNITKSFKLIKKGRTKLHQAVDAKYLDKIVAEVSEYNYHLGLMFKFIFFTLHRIQTITSIQFRNIDLENNLIHLSSDIVKNHQEITITLAQPLKDIILEYSKGNEISGVSYLFGRDKFNNINLFGEKRSSANTFSSQFSTFKAKKLKSGQPTLITEFSSLYMAKHSSIKFLLDNGLSLNSIITISGHTSIDQLGAYAKDYRPKKVQFPTLPHQE